MKAALPAILYRFLTAVQSTPPKWPNILHANPGYYFTDWNKNVETTVTQKATYVAQYAKIIEEASYRVRYLDTYGNELATQKVVAASKGGTVVEYARPIDGYIPDAEGKTTTIAAEGTEIDLSIPGR